MARTRLVRRLLSDRQPLLSIDPRVGNRLIAPGQLPDLDAAVAWSPEPRARRAELLPHILAARAGKHRILFDLLSDVDLARQPKWIDFALGDELVDGAID